MTDWSAYVACTQCEAKAGEACYLLLARGPEAGPSVMAEVPHSSRKLGGQKSQPVATPRKQVATLPQRRAARKAESQADAWAAIADRKNRG